MTFSSHGVVAYYTGVDFAPTNHKEKKEMAENKRNLQFDFSQIFCRLCLVYPKLLCEEQTWVHNNHAILHPIAIRSNNNSNTVISNGANNVKIL